MREDELEERVVRIRRKIEDFVEDHGLDDRVSRIMHNMHPRDVEKVLLVNFPDDCRNPSGFVVSQIRKTETEACRPKDYRWDGRSWSEDSRGGGGGKRDRGGRDDGRFRDDDRDGGYRERGYRDGGYRDGGYHDGGYRDGGYREERGRGRGGRFRDSRSRSPPRRRPCYRDDSRGRPPPRRRRGDSRGYR